MAHMFALFGLATMVAAQTTTVDIMLMGMEAESLYASVVDVKDSLTTFSMDCEDKDTCGLVPQTIIQGDDIFSAQLHLTPGEAFGGGAITQDFRCDIGRTETELRCTVTQEGVIDGTYSSESLVATIERADGLFLPVPVTGGVEKLGTVEVTSPAATEGRTTVTETPSQTRDGGEETPMESSEGHATETNGGGDDDNAGLQLGQDIVVAGLAVAVGVAALL